MEYPKINSLYKREEQKVNGVRPLILGEYSCPEFQSIKYWTIDEKVDGTNIRITFQRPVYQEDSIISFGGRTDNAQIPCQLFDYLQKTFTHEKMDEIFKDSSYVVLFGEGYGPKIQNGGYYRADVSFILFDVYCSGWWLKKEDVIEVANKLGISHTPILSKSHAYDSWTVEEIVEYVKSKPKSVIATVQEREMEGVIARSEPQMLFRDGKPIMFKLKCKDFACT